MCGSVYDTPLLLSGTDLSPCVQTTVLGLSLSIIGRDDPAWVVSQHHGQVDPGHWSLSLIGSEVGLVTARAALHIVGGRANSRALIDRRARLEQVAVKGIDAFIRQAG